VITSDTIYLGKNLDWELGNGLIIFNPQNHLKKSCVSDSKWRSKYSSITFNQFGKNQPLGGINEAGLVIEELSTWPCEYSDRNGEYNLSEFEWIQFNLDKFATVEELLKKINKISVCKFIFSLHYIAADKKGNCAIIEFIEGKPKIYTGNTLPQKVLTNNNYSELLRYSELVDYSSGNMENSQDRFLKIVDLIKRNKVTDNNYAMSILDSVRVSDTRWSIIYNISENTIYYKTDISNKTYTISFDIFSEDSFYFMSFYKKNKTNFKTLSQYQNNSYLLSLIDSLSKKNNEEADLIKDKINSLINNN
jgi:choloylglycine hydrolase